MDEDPIEVERLTEGTLLGGRVIYRQFASGYRTGVEPVLLAASVPARPGEHVMEAGTGAGAGLLALTERVAGLHCLGIERDAALARLAEANLAANGRAECRISVADVTSWRGAGLYDHAFANPPWHSDDGSLSPDAGRLGAKFAEAGLLARWVRCLAAGLRRRGTLSLILPVSALQSGAVALAHADCGEVSLLPLWPRAGTPARLIILRGVRSGRGLGSVQPGMTLHESNGRYTEAAEGVLRAGAPLGHAMAGQAEGSR